jgi:hypothetical protein
MEFNFTGKNDETVVKYKGLSIRFIKCESVTNKYNNKVFLFKPNTHIIVNEQEIICTRLIIRPDGSFEYN